MRSVPATVAVPVSTHLSDTENHQFDFCLMFDLTFFPSSRNISLNLSGIARHAAPIFQRCVIFSSDAKDADASESDCCDRKLIRMSRSRACAFGR